MKNIGLLLCLVTAAFACSCGGGGGSASSENVQVLLTDAPAPNLESVFVTIRNVRIHQSASASERDAGWRDIAVTADMPVDLLTLRGRAKKIGERTLPPGHYQQIRLVLAEGADAGHPANYVVLNGGAIRPLNTSGGDTGLKINRQFTVLTDAKTVITIDFDAEKSVNMTGNGTYRLKPVLSATVSSVPLAAAVTR